LPVDAAATADSIRPEAYLPLELQKRTINSIETAMPRLLLLRHAKSSWAEPGMADRDRPLAPRGRRAAERMAAEMESMGLLPDRILCSPARRTRETLAPLLPMLAEKNAVAILEALYESSADEYRGAIAANAGDAESLLVIGHNPAIQATALGFIGTAKNNAAARLAAKFPTAALAVIAFDGTGWPDLRPKSGRLELFLRPRDLDEDDVALEAD
jgi:phosphohistidine phosphatase